MPVDSGAMIDHNKGMHTYMKKQASQLKEAYDLTLLPPVLIKNALPCDLSIMGGQ
jgi:hypothetical protein